MSDPIFGDIEKKKDFSACNFVVIVDDVIFLNLCT